MKNLYFKGAKMAILALKSLITENVEYTNSILIKQQLPVLTGDELDLGVLHLTVKYPNKILEILIGAYNLSHKDSIMLNGRYVDLDKFTYKSGNLVLMESWFLDRFHQELSYGDITTVKLIAKLLKKIEIVPFEYNEPKANPYRPYDKIQTPYLGGDDIQTGEYTMYSPLDGINQKFIVLCLDINIEGISLPYCNKVPNTLFTISSIANRRSIIDNMCSLWKTHYTEMYNDIPIYRYGQLVKRPINKKAVNEYCIAQFGMNMKALFKVAEANRSVVNVIKYMKPHVNCFKRVSTDISLYNQVLIYLKNEAKMQTKEEFKNFFSTIDFHSENFYKSIKEIYENNEYIPKLYKEEVLGLDPKYLLYNMYQSVIDFTNELVNGTVSFYEDTEALFNNRSAFYAPIEDDSNLDLYSYKDEEDDDSEEETDDEEEAEEE